MVHGKTLLRQLAEQIADSLALQVQVHAHHTARLLARLLGQLAHLAVAIQVGVLGLELLHRGEILEVMDRLLISFAHLDEVNGEGVVHVALLHIVREVPALPLDEGRVFVQRLQQREDFLQLLRRELAPVGQILQAHFLRAVLQQDAIEVIVVVHVVRALLARDRVERRLRNIDEPLLHELVHLPVEERQQQRADVRAVHIGVRHDDDLVVA